MLVSVLIPTRNRSALVSRAMASVLRQSHQNLELIVINDGSEAVPSLADGRIHLLDSGQRGAVPARNLGLGHARGELIAWLDDDDCWTDAAFLEMAISAVNKGADFIFGDGRFVFDDGRMPKPYSRNATATSLESDNTILVSAIAYRPELHRHLGQFDEALPYYWDWDWYLRVARSGATLHHLAVPVVDIAVHGSNMSGDANAPARRENLTRLEQKHGLLPIPLKVHLDLV